MDELIGSLKVHEQALMDEFFNLLCLNPCRLTCHSILRGVMAYRLSNFLSTSLILPWSRYKLLHKKKKLSFNNYHFSFQPNINNFLSYANN